MAQQAEHTLSQALAAFDFGGPAQGALRFGEGHINDTFLEQPLEPAEGPAGGGEQLLRFRRLVADGALHEGVNPPGRTAAAAASSSSG